MPDRAAQLRLVYSTLTALSVATLASACDNPDQPAPLADTGPESSGGEDWDEASTSAGQSDADTSRDDTSGHEGSDTSEDVYSGQSSAELRTRIEGLGITEAAAAPPVSDDLYELGRALSFDKILSGNRNISCMSCHHPTLASGDARHLPLGQGGMGLGPQRSGGHIIPRNSPPIYNLHLYETMFWDSRVRPDGQGGFESPAGSELTPEMLSVMQFGPASIQAMFPVTSHHEMRGDPGDNEIADAASLTEVWDRLMQRIAAIPEYVDMFESAYPSTDFEDMSFAHAANAIAAFEIAGFEFIDSPWNRFVAGDDTALSNKQSKGAQEFFDSNCQTCHSGPAFSDFGHHNIGLPQFGPGKGDGPSGHDDFGHERVSGDPADRYKFRTAPLLNVTLAGPWGHVGQYSSLKEFVKHYIKPQQSLDKYKIEKHVGESALHDMEVDNRDEIAASISPLVDALPKLQVNKIVDFMDALTDPAADDLDHLIPDQVPSGLPVGD